MKNNLSYVILAIFDVLAIYVSITGAYHFSIDSKFFIDMNMTDPMVYYAHSVIIYFVVLSTFFYHGIYSRRYDFWHESRQIIKSLALSFLFVMSFLVFTKYHAKGSETTIVFAFLLMLIIIPICKNILKKILYRIGLWQTKAKIYGNNTFVKDEIFKNIYLGYVEAESANTVFINPEELDANGLRRLIDEHTKQKHEIIFIPLVNDYNLTQSHIYELSNVRTNLIVFQNRLRSKYRILLQQILNYIFALVLLPITSPVLVIIAFFVKRESPGPVFFTHDRIGKNGKILPIIKFRSMYADAEERLKKLLAADESIKEEWEKNFKLKNDPRITRVGAFLRKTSLDELPQIFNVLMGEMNLVGPRPVVAKELEMYYKEDAEYYLMVKPGITGLWQVSGRSDTDYEFRINTDKWYVRNWSLWLDIVILVKTIKVVLLKDGAY